MPFGSESSDLQRIWRAESHNALPTMISREDALGYYDIYILYILYIIYILYIYILYIYTHIWINYDHLTGNDGELMGESSQNGRKFQVSELL